MGWDYASFERREATAGPRPRNDGRFPSTDSPIWVDAWCEDRERLKPSALTVLTEHPLLTLALVLLFGTLVFGHVLP